ncbi:MAG: signal peptidase II [Acetobacteraceae bacterium]
MVLLGLASLVTIGVDQAVKALVLRHIRLAESRPCSRWWKLRAHRGRGLVLRFPLSFAALAWALASAIGVGWALVSFPDDTTLACTGAALGGAAGNFADKLFRGAIIDFIVVWRKSFNLADVAIIAGIAGVLLSMV